ncbi:MAG: glycosyltransferase family 39 protein [Leptospirales bacterium]|nr:glycosyltransferase family 39 protein [Leptospirales bacterium]
MLDVLNKAARYLFSRWTLLVLIALFFTLIIRLITLQFPDDLNDSKYYIDAAKRLAGSLPYSLDQYSSRFGIILPVYHILPVTGGAAAGYYILPLVYSLLACFFVLKSAKLLNKARSGFIAALLLAVCPGMSRAGSQLLPDIFSMVYLLAAFYFIIKYTFKKTNIIYIAASAVFIFLSYEVCVTNIFSSFGIALIIILNKQKPWKAVTLFFALLLAFYITETLIYRIFTEYPFGRLEIIWLSHLNAPAGALKPGGFFALAKSQPLLLVLFVIATYYALVCLKEKKYLQLSAYLPALCLIIGGLFSLKNVSPAILPQPIYAALPFILITTAFFASNRFSVERLELFSITFCILVPLLTAAICCKNILHYPLGALISADRELKASLKNYIPLVYSAEDSVSFTKYADMSYRQKQKINSDAYLGIRNPYMETFEEYKKIAGSIDFINAFFTDEQSRLSRVVAFHPEGEPALLCVSREFAFTLNWDEYLASLENPLLRIHRSPLRLEKIEGTSHETPREPETL